MFVWIFHRVSGVILIVLMGIKIATGLGIMGRFGVNVIETMRALHREPALDLPLLGLFIYHALYGLRTIAIDMGLKRERLLFWISTLLGLLLFIWLTIVALTPNLGT
jgi:succinate dehydrogenase/fumarate reductase cytochrome b subunit